MRYRMPCMGWSLFLSLTSQLLCDQTKKGKVLIMLHGGTSTNKCYMKHVNKHTDAHIDRKPGHT